MDVSDATPRPGTGADLARRVDRLESRVDDLAATVARVEQNQLHATELNKLRFDSLDTGLKSVDGQLRDFIRRIEGIIEGSVETAQSRLGREMVEDYKRWRATVDERLDQQDERNARGEGVWVALGGVKGAVLLGAAVASPLITVVVLLTRGA